MLENREVIARGWSSLVLRDSTIEEESVPGVIKVRRSSIHGFTSPTDCAGLADAWSREGEALRALRGVEGIIHLLGETQVGGAPAYRLRKAEGVVLSEVDQVGRWSVEETSQVVAAAARAVGRMHDAGWLHLDLNPSNVMYCRESGSVTLLDLGAVAKSGTRATWSWPLGRHVFMAPEQLAVIEASPGPRLGPAADVHQLAFLAAFLLTGEHPYRSCGAEDYRSTYLPLVLRWSREAGIEKVAFVALVRPDVPGWMVALLAACADPRPDRRPAVLSLERVMRNGDLR